VQKDNWEQLPLIINLCNKVNAYIYVSYLERPIQFVLTTLPKEELKRVRQYMEQFAFPKLTQKERHNAKCFEDFKHYLDTYIENTDIKKYHEYEFNREVYTSKERENNQPEYREAKPVTQAEFEEWLHKQYNSDESFNQLMPPAQLCTQLAPVLSEYSEQERNLLYALIMQGSFEPFLQSVKNCSADELKELSRKSLNQYNNPAVTV
jgi:hypothetical protein